jgi:uncharacterized circularly permuted ATP-grasp superfamily protein
MDLSTYDPDEQHFFDEVFATPGQVRSGFEPLTSGLELLGLDAVLKRQESAEQALLRAGITFTLRKDDGDGPDAERIFPFDIIPRVIGAHEWERMQRGIVQRLTALNLFLSDIYGEQRVLRDKILPEYLVATCPDFRKACIGLKPPRGIWCHISGTDLVRDQSGQFMVLEDNLRCPSGVSYVLENRQILKRTFPRMFQQMSIRPVDDYPVRLLEMLRYLASDRVDQPHVVVLTPGRYNSAYFEHTFLAQQMGVELVESVDLVVRDDFVYLKSTAGLQRGPRGL